MRPIGTIADELHAKNFGDFLLANQIPNQVDASSKGGWVVWIERDEHLDRASAELAAFEKNPGDAKYHGAARSADAVRNGQAKADKRRTENFIDVRTKWSRPRQFLAPVTLTLIGICLVVGVLTRLGSKPAPVGDWLKFATISQQEYDERLDKIVREQGFVEMVRRTVSTGSDQWLQEMMNERSMSQILHGQVWRLVTPIFLHFGILHLLFNMFWLRDLGAAVEFRRGTMTLIWLVLGSAVASNVAQFLWNGPNFGGMSGVVYALFGYVWVKGKLQPHLGLGMNQQTVTIMLIWLVACMFGLLGPIANAAHVAGLIVGCAVAGAPVWWKKLRRVA